MYVSVFSLIVSSLLAEDQVPSEPEAVNEFFNSDDENEEELVVHELGKLSVLTKAYLT